MKSTSDKELFQNATPVIFKLGRDLRKNMTKAEVILWNVIRGKNLKDLRFRRQHPIAKFVVDFYCHEKKLVIELDGNVHDTEEAKEKDKLRSELLEQLGLKVIRFRNEEVLNNLKEVVKKIISEVE